MRLLALALAVSSVPVVPWIGTKPARGPAHPPLAAPCRASQLRASLFLQGATGSFGGAAQFTNAGLHACSLVGRPRLSFSGATSRWQVGTLPPGLEPPPSPLADPIGSLRALAPGKAASVTLWWSNWCGAGFQATGNPGRLPSALLLGLPGGTAVLLKPTQAPRCDQPARPSLISAGRFLPGLRHLPDSSRLPLLATIVGRMPIRVKGNVHAFVAHRGSVLDYTVVLTNTGSRPFRFRGACPAYVQDFATQEAYVLNCRPAGTMLPNASVRFAMRLRVPVRQRLGYNAVGWTLAPFTYDAPETAAPVEVVP
jgi:hypothetical protein